MRKIQIFSGVLKSDSQSRKVDLNEVIVAVVNDFEFAIEEKKATINIGKMPTIRAISLQMNQLFFNLLSNALKFGKQGVPMIIDIICQPISLETAEKFVEKPFSYAQYYHLTFTDNGIGFETQYSEQIFEVFKRLHGSDIYPGSGIGLALCKRIVANHNGVLFALSTPGEGSVFNIILPDRQYDQESGS